MSDAAAKYIPQAPPMVMVDHYVTGDERSTTAELLVRADNIFVENGHFAEAGLVEHMAQTVALHAGKQAVAGEPPKIGYIGALKDLKIKYLPAVGSLLRTTIQVTHLVLGATVIQGETLCDGKQVASCEMKIFIQERENE